MPTRAIREVGIAGPAAEIAMSKGLSRPAIKLAKQIDSVRPGEYTIELSKTKWPVGIVAEISIRKPEPATKADAQTTTD